MKPIATKPDASSAELHYVSVQVMVLKLSEDKRAAQSYKA